MDVLIPLNHTENNIDKTTNNKKTTKFYRFCIKIYNFFKKVLQFILKPFKCLLNIFSKKITNTNTTNFLVSPEKTNPAPTQAINTFETNQNTKEEAIKQLELLNPLNITKDNVVNDDKHTTQNSVDHNNNQTKEKVKIEPLGITTNNPEHDNQKLEIYISNTLINTTVDDNNQDTQEPKIDSSNTAADNITTNNQTIQEADNLLELLNKPKITAENTALDINKITKESKTLANVIFNSIKANKQQEPTKSLNAIQALNSYFDNFFINQNLSIEEKIAILKITSGQLIDKIELDKTTIVYKIKDNKEKIVTTKEIKNDMMLFMSMAEKYCLIDYVYQSCLPPEHEPIPLYKQFISEELLSKADDFNAAGCFAFECKTGYIPTIISSYICLLKKVYNGKQIDFDTLINIANKQNALIPTKNTPIDITKNNWKHTTYHTYIYSDEKFDLNQILFGSQISLISDRAIKHEEQPPFTEASRLLDEKDRRQLEIVRNFYKLNVKLDEKKLDTNDFGDDGVSKFVIANDYYLLPDFNPIPTLGDKVFNLVKDSFFLKIRFGCNKKLNKNCLSINLITDSYNRIKIVKEALKGYYNYLNDRKNKTRKNIVKHAYSLCGLLRRTQPYTDFNTRLLFISLLPALLAEQGLMLEKAVYDNPRFLTDHVPAENFWEMVKDHITELPQLNQEKLNLLNCLIKKMDITCITKLDNPAETSNPIELC